LVLFNPELKMLQLDPPFVVLNRPPLDAAYTIDGFVLSIRIDEYNSPVVIPELAAAHVRPASVLLKTPLLFVPAYRVEPETARDRISSVGRLAFMAVHVAPPLVVLNTPEPNVAAYIVDVLALSMAIADIANVVVSPELLAAHELPPFVDLKTPPFVPA
jgi:hypothetical protein